MNGVLYEDNHLIVVYKKANVPIQADSSKDLDLLTIVKDYLKEKYQKPGNVYLGLVHRLDRPVSGIVVFAKTSKAASRLSDMIRKREFKKVYHAVVLGKAKDKERLVDYLKKDTKSNTSYVSKDGKESSLNYELMEYNDKEKLSLVKIYLETGRSHQIRVQFSSRNMPLYGDQRYNTKSIPNTQLALFASEVSFNHPVTKEKMIFNLDLPCNGIWRQFKTK